MDAAISPLWPSNDPFFDLDHPSWGVSSQRRGHGPVDGLEAIVEELELLTMAASVRRDARLAVGEHAWEVIAEDADVRVVIPA